MRFTRNVGNIVMDLNDVETIDVNALGGADNLDRQRPVGHRRHQRDADLAANGGGDDGAADNVVVNGTNGDDVVTSAGDGAERAGRRPGCAGLGDRRDRRPATG